MNVGGIRGPGQPIIPRRAELPAPGADFAQALKKVESPVNSESLTRPVPGRVLKDFSDQHPGIDLQAEINTSVLAAGNGTVESAGWAGSYGNLLVVRHSSSERAYYAHLGEMAVHPGQQVNAGDSIAKSGNTGQVTQPHLHFEIRSAGKPINPQSRLG